MIALLVAIAVVAFVTVPRSAPRQPLVASPRRWSARGRWDRQQSKRGGYQSVAERSSAPWSVTERSSVPGKRRQLDLGAIVTEVATRLRAGAMPAQAWKLTLPNYGLAITEPVLGPDGVPYVLAELGNLSWWQRWWRRIGQEELAALPATFAVCRMSGRSGAPMAEILDACALTITEAGEARAAREIALAGPITSARTLALLPVAGILLGYALGVDPVQFIFGTALGKLVLMAGLGFELLGIGWVLRLIARAKAGELAGSFHYSAVDEAVVLDLASAGLGSGMAIPDLLRTLHLALIPPGAADASNSSIRRPNRTPENKSLLEVANLLLMGATWAEAWENAGLLRLAGALQPAWDDGAAPLPLLARSAQSLRLARARLVREDAERLGAKLVLPLGLCFLPAFVLLGVVPIVVSAAGTLF
ncbi:MAG: hypothetical protein Q4E03_01280 [Trueperella sp.]|nr:hypothetical protein [Trueperella sp.]